MRISSMNWMQVEKLLAGEDRAVLPIGCTEQHSYLSLATDSLLAERVAVDAAEPLQVPVFPVIPYGITPTFRAYPGTVSLRVGTLLEVVRDALDAFDSQGFRRVLIVNGHGGNSPLSGLVNEWMGAHPRTKVRLHNWWNAPRTLEKVHEIDPVASHASWMENFPWTRVEGVTPPDTQKAMVDLRRLAVCNPDQARELLGDGNFGGRFVRSDDDMFALWRVAVEETRDLIENGWG